VLLPAISAKKKPNLIKQALEQEAVKSREKKEPVPRVVEKETKETKVKIQGKKKAPLEVKEETLVDAMEKLAEGGCDTRFSDLCAAVCSL